eukprot:4693193-Amphidinium_carterae.1
MRGSKTPPTDLFVARRRPLPLPEGSKLPRCGDAQGKPGAHVPDAKVGNNDYNLLVLEGILVNVDVAGQDVVGVLELVHADAVGDVDVPEGMFGDVVVVELIVLHAEVGNALLVLGGILVDVDVDISGLDVLGDDVFGLVHADVVEDVDVLKEMFGNVGVVELIVLDAEVGNDLLVLEGILFDVDVAGLDVHGGDVLRLVHAMVVEDIAVLKEILGDVGVEKYNNSARCGSGSRSWADRKAVVGRGFPQCGMRRGPRPH